MAPRPGTAGRPRIICPCRDSQPRTPPPKRAAMDWQHSSSQLPVAIMRPPDPPPAGVLCNDRKMRELKALAHPSRATLWRWESKSSGFFFASGRGVAFVVAPLRRAIATTDGLSNRRRTACSAHDPPKADISSSLPLYPPQRSSTRSSHFAYSLTRLR